MHTNEGIWLLTSGIGRNAKTIERAVLPLLALIAAHAVMALAMKSSSLVATAHSVISIAAALAIALFGPRLYMIVCAVAYLTGAEVLWRMCDAGGPWELGKFGVTAVVLVSLTRLRQYVLPPSAVLYGLLLMPGVIITYVHTPLLSTALSRLSTHISGPMTLFACMCFFANIRLTKQEIGRTLFTLIIPISSVCFLAARGTFSGRVVFGNESSHAASGGFGPNQVSSVLGLAALVLMLHLVRTPAGLWRKLLLGGIVAACLGQSALTLSRSGTYASIGAFLPAMFFLMGDRESRKRMLIVASMSVIVGVSVIYPMLDNYTGGAITRRFNEQGMSGREALMNIDFEIWFDNPVFGVGVGRSQLFHPVRGNQLIMTHNEFTRALAEHGIFGLAALAVLGLVALMRIVRAQTMDERAFAAALMTWSALFLFANGMRMAAPAFTFGLAILAIRPNIAGDPRR